MGEDDNERHKEQELAAQREEDGLARLSDALEETSGNHLEAYDGEQQTVVAHAHDGHLNHLCIGSEDASYGTRGELADEEG